VLYHSEVLAKQKSRIKWMEEGDLNTRYYRRMINWRKVKNSIRGIHVGSGWCEDPTTVKEEIRNKCLTRFSEQCRPRVLLDRIAFPRISDADNDLLTKEILEEEVKGTVWIRGI